MSKIQSEMTWGKVQSSDADPKVFQMWELSETFKELLKLQFMRWRKTDEIHEKHENTQEDNREPNENLET